MELSQETLEIIQYTIIIILKESPIFEKIEFAKIDDKEKYIVGTLKVDTTWASRGTKIQITIYDKDVFLYIQEIDADTIRGKFERFVRVAGFSLFDVRIRDKLI